MMVNLKISELLTEILYAKENESGSIELRSLLLSQVTFGFKQGQGLKELAAHLPPNIH